MNHFIEHLDGNVVKADGTFSNVMDLLGVEASPLNVPNDGRGQTISAFVIDGKQYAVSAILDAVNTRISSLETKQSRYPIGIKITGAGTELSPYQTNYTFAQIKKVSNAYITLNNTPAAQIVNTVSNNEITKVTAKFAEFAADAMTVTTIEITSTGITGSTKEYTLTEASDNES